MTKTMHILFFSSLCLALSPTLYSPQLQGYAIPIDVSQKAKPATVKILLVEKADHLIVEAKGKYQLCDLNNHFVITSGSSVKRAKVTHDPAGIRWGDLIPGAFQVRLVPKDSETTLLINGLEYRGCIDLYDIDGKFTVINEVDAESFLRSTLSNRFRNDLPDELMRAIAIAARSHLYYEISKGGNNCLYHMTKEQALYRGHGATLINTQLEKAISDTRHAVMTYQGSFFPATWTENCAGRTAEYSTIFRKKVATPQGVALAFAESDRLKTGWSFSISRDQLAQVAHVQNIDRISLFSDQSSGKVYAIRVAEAQQMQQILFQDLQNAFGEENIKSNDFTIDVRGDTITFKGYGQGLGTGLCLYSSHILAQKNQDALQILTTFFPGVKIVKLRSLPDHH